MTRALNSSGLATGSLGVIVAAGAFVACATPERPDNIRPAPNPATTNATPVTVANIRFFMEVPPLPLFYRVTRQNLTRQSLTGSLAITTAAGSITRAGHWVN